METHIRHYEVKSVYANNSDMLLFLVVVSGQDWIHLELCRSLNHQSRHQHVGGCNVRPEQFSRLG